jgi:pimeloyl-ACP methyl ester carboxylesterase
VFRFDYHGVGESTGSIEGYRLDRPFVEDLEAVSRWLADIGLRRLVLVGSCFGSRTILAAADGIAGLAGVVLASTPPRDFEMGDQVPSRYAREMTLGQLVAKALRLRVWRNLLAPKNRESYLRSRHVYRRTATMKVRMILNRLYGRSPAAADAGGYDFSPLFLSQFRALMQRRVPLLMLYGTEENFYRYYRQVCEGPLHDLIAHKHDAYEVQLVEGVIHGFTTLEVQDAVLERTVAWIGRL